MSDHPTKYSELFGMSSQGNGQPHDTWIDAKKAESMGMKPIPQWPPACPMPQYKSKKLVWALEIDSVLHLTSEVEIRFTDKRFLPKMVKPEVISRHWPKHGDFFVVYEDGYQSISPRKAFLEGYDRI